jgi:hypothetical protein
VLPLSRAEESIGGKLGGSAATPAPRSSRLKRRKDIARKAAAARWGKKKEKQ